MRRIAFTSVSLAAVASPFTLVAACHKQPMGTGYVAEAGPIRRPADPLSREQAERYVLALVNHDRKEQGLSELTWDETAAAGGRRHAEDMARHGYTAHWGTDGSVPEERYTAAGGTDLALENAACFFDGATRNVEAAPTYKAVDLEKIEAAFMAETPPNDGHKQNILKPRHTRFGVGLSMPIGVGQPCMSQEFVDDYGDYEGLPHRARVGQVVAVRGSLDAPLKFAAVGIARIERAKPLTAQHLNSTYTYTIPKSFVLYTPPGFQTPKPVKVNGRKFAIDVPLTDQGQPGRYEISIWATFPGSSALAMVSLRVVDVE